ncbi:MAG: hypothetical protein IKW54_04100 [Bacteroidales bacterium]|nr:hypothetical protein [Bacteroidales bacterium]
MNKNQLTTAINNLAKKRPAFYSEADFQFSLAWELKTLLPNVLPNANIYLERYEPTFNYHVDIWVEENGEFFPIELKYKTRKDDVIINRQTVTLKDHAAVTLGSYDYLKDIRRIEDLSQLPGFKKGYAVMLTNEPIYYKPSKTNSSYNMFKICEGLTKQANVTMNWGLTNKQTPFQATKGRGPFALKNTYQMHWDSYNNIYKYEFKYIISEI